MVATRRSTVLDLPIATVLTNPRVEWSRLAAGRVRTASCSDVDWKKFSQDQYLFSQCSIVASVNVEDNGYHIDPACSPLVNNNGNAWSTPVLLSTFRTFEGGENYVEHVQVPALSKGKILDAVARPVRYHNEKLGRDTDVYFVDILVGTNRKHGDLCHQIVSGEMNTLSMGCLADWVQCSRCGVELGDDDPNCEHLEKQMLSTFVDEKGVERVVAELCGRLKRDRKGELVRDANGGLVGDPESLRFIEASWVRKPAFEGAVLNHLLNEVPELKAVTAFDTSALQMVMDDIFKLRVADRSGMLVLRVAQMELLRRRRESMTDKMTDRMVKRFFR